MNMKNLVAEVYVPGLDMTLDLLIPSHVTAGQAIRLIAQIINKKVQISLDTDGLILYDAENNAVLEPDITFGEAPVPDACSLVLI
jgi:hypothetical protein